MSKSPMKYHPRVGYTYMPGTELRLPGPGDGCLVRANQAGFRSDREFVSRREPGVFRAFLFGDSQSAADGVDNSQRYSDLLEKALPGLEVLAVNPLESPDGVDRREFREEAKAILRRPVDHRDVAQGFNEGRSKHGLERFQSSSYFDL